MRWKTRLPAEVPRSLRQRSTQVEDLLWETLRGRKLCRAKFRRQYPITGTAYVVDFCCPEAGLIVEIDGPIHRGQREADAARQREIEEIGYRFLRFSNEAIQEHISEVLNQVMAALKNPPSPPAPLPSATPKGTPAYGRGESARRRQRSPLYRLRERGRG